MLEFLWSCMVISFKGMFGTVLWFFGIGGIIGVFGLIAYWFITDQNPGIEEIPPRPDPPPPPTPEDERKPTSTVSLEDFNKKDTIH